MGNAYLLLEVVPGASNEVADRLTQLSPSAVPYAAAVWGPWDVVARVTLNSLRELLDFVDELRIKTDNKIIRTETWCVRDDQLPDNPLEHDELSQEDRLAFIMLRVNPGHGQLTDVLRYVCTPSTSTEGAQVWHAAGVLGPYDIAATIRYKSDLALTNLVMNRFQGHGRLLGIKDTLTIPSIVGMVHPQRSVAAGNRNLLQDGRDLSAFGSDFVAKFPVAAREVEMAGECYANGLATACVFHLMRSIEIGLRAVAASLKITMKERNRNWGGLLDRIKDELDQRSKDTSTNQINSSEIKFYRSILASFSAFKTAWRNPTMHHEHDYTADEARNVFISVRDIMKTLALRMDETGKRTATEVHAES